MRTLPFLLPGDPETLTGGYLYDKRLVEALRRLGQEVRLHRLSPRFPQPDAAALADARQLLAGLEAGALAIIDGLAFGAMPEVLRAEAERLMLIALVHHPLAMESGLNAAARDQLFQAERAALATARHIIVTSPATARDLSDYAVEPARLSVMLPGLEPGPLAVGSGGPGLALLCVASLTPRKGHAVLIEALSRLSALAWQLTCIGGAQHDPPTAAAIHRLVADKGLAARIAFPGECRGQALSQWYQKSDAFVLASHHEGYGMALAEAMAHGLPVVSTTAGAIPDTVPTSAGLLVPPGDPDALAEALQRLMTDKELRRRLSAGARQATAAHPTWHATARRFQQLLARVSG